MTRVHGTALALGSRGILLRGASGSGKSDLALRCLALAANIYFDHQFRLVADDQVLLSRDQGGISMSCPAPLRDLLEVRGVGIVQVPAVAEIQLKVVVELVSADLVSRMPERRTTAILDVEIPTVALFPFECSAPLKLALAVDSVTANDRLDKF